MQDFSRDWSLREYWRERMRTHGNDSYKGRNLVKMPEDLRTYQRVIEWSRPTAIVELGTYAGGSAVWFLDQLRTFCEGCLTPTVVTVDLHSPAAFTDPDIHFVEGDLRDEAVRERVTELVHGHRVMVVDDSAHTYEVTTAALEHYSPLVPEAAFFVVEDGVVDEPDLTIWEGGGVQPAIRDFLATARGSRFEQQWLAPFGLTMHFGGWLQARS